MKNLAACAFVVIALGLATPALGAASFGGVYLEGIDFSPESTVSTTSLLAAGGITSIRADFEWRRIEPHRGEYDWTTSDRMVAGAARAGADLLVTVFAAPTWAAAGDGFANGIRPPGNPADYGAFLRALVSRYGPDGAFWRETDAPYRPVRVWQMWNEPNIPAFWVPSPDPVAYARVAVAGAEAVHGVDPGAEVVLAGVPFSSIGVEVVPFLNAVYREGAVAAVDSIAVHPYASDAQTVLANATAVRMLAIAHGDASKPLRVTEFGWASGGLPSTLTLDETGQARRLAEATVALRQASRGLNLRGLVAFKWRDNPRPLVARNIWPYHSGLLRADGSAKPAFVAYVVALHASLPAIAAVPRPATALALSLRTTRQARGTRIRVRLRASAASSAAVTLTRARRETGRIVRQVVARRELSLRPGVWRHIRLRLARAPRQRDRLVASAAAVGADGLAARASSVQIRFKNSQRDRRTP